MVRSALDLHPACLTARTSSPYLSPRHSRTCPSPRLDENPPQNRRFWQTIFRQRRCHSTTRSALQSFPTGCCPRSTSSQRDHWRQAMISCESLPPGWLFNNCYQFDDGSWRVNLRKPDNDGAWFTEWAIGPTFADAVDDCISKLHDAEFRKDLPVTSSIDRSSVKPERPAFLAKLISAAKPSSTPISRRGF